MTVPIAAAARASYSGTMERQGLSVSANTAADPAAFEREMAALVVSALQLETTPADIDPEAPMFGDGLGLDSIDALELSMAVARDYGVELKSDHARNQQIFASLRALSGYVADHRTK